MGDRHGSETSVNVPYFTLLIFKSRESFHIQKLKQRNSLRKEASPRHFSLSVPWLELGHMATLSCQGVWEMSILLVRGPLQTQSRFRKRGRRVGDETLGSIMQGLP